MAEVQTGINWEEVKASLLMEDWEACDSDIIPNLHRQVFLGTVFALMPSGKYYTPWANSNVQVCFNCANAGGLPCDELVPCVMPEPLRLGQAYYDTIEGFVLDKAGSFQEATCYKDYPQAEYHCEACADALYAEALEAEAEAQGLWITSGEGDPCDIMIGQSKD